MKDFLKERRHSRAIRVGTVQIGGDAPVSIQSMTNTDPLHYEETLAQVKALHMAGCDIVRLAVPTMASVETVRRLKRDVPLIPLVADIHFDTVIRPLAGSSRSPAERI